jgi:hypothetical protein
MRASNLATISLIEKSPNAAETKSSLVETALTISGFVILGLFFVAIVRKK